MTTEGTTKAERTYFDPEGMVKRGIPECCANCPPINHDVSQIAVGEALFGSTKKDEELADLRQMTEGCTGCETLTTEEIDAILADRYDEDERSEMLDSIGYRCPRTGEIGIAITYVQGITENFTVMDQTDAVVERLTEYSKADATGIGRLMPFLSERFGDKPMSDDLLRTIIDSPNHEQLVARLDGIIVGAATLNILMGPAVGKEGYLEDFVTDPAVRGQGIGDRIWQEILDWCEEQGINLSFTSHPNREEAHRFYLKHGAKIRDTTVFHVSVE